MSIFILSCGVFEPELNKVLKEIKEENIFNEYINVKYLPFGLHSNLDKLKSEIVTNLDKIKDNKIILLYGNKCHYKFHDFLKDYDDVITFDDMRNETLMLMHRGWSSNGDKLRDDIIENYPDINISDFDLYNIDVFNRCENNQELLLAFKGWESVHPLIRIKSVEWDYTMPYGLLYSKEPSAKVKKLVKAIEQVK